MHPDSVKSQKEWDLDQDDQAEEERLVTDIERLTAQRDKLLGALVSAVRRIEDLASIVNVLSPGKLRSEDYTRHARELIKELKP